MSILFASIAQHADAFPDRIALAGTHRAVPYDLLQKEITDKAAILKESGAKVVGLQLSNGPDWIIWDLAALKAGAVTVPLPGFFSAEQAAYVVAAAGIEQIVTPNGLTKTGRMAAPYIPLRTSKITFTSGTTGMPKGVCLPQAGMEAVAQSLVNAIGPVYAERHLSVMPLPILLENVAGVYASLIAGATIHLPDPEAIGMANPFQPDFMKLAAVVERDRITSMILVPELLRGLIQAAKAKPEMFFSLRFVAVGGSKLAPFLIAAARSLGLPVYEGYGLSECSSVVALNTPSTDHAGTVGVVLPHIQVSIRDGEIIIENPAFLGYLGQENVEGPFATGDLGQFTAEGALQISGRRKNIIITSQGRNIAPEWIESLCLAQPEIAQVMVYGDALPFPEALIVPLHKDADIAAAVERVNQTLPLYAQIAGFTAVPPFTPQNGLLTATGRPRREAIAVAHRSIMEKEKNHDILRNAG